MLEEASLVSAPDYAPQLSDELVKVSVYTYLLPIKPRSWAQAALSAFHSTLRFGCWYKRISCHASALARNASRVAVAITSVAHHSRVWFRHGIRGTSISVTARTTLVNAPAISPTVPLYPCSGINERKLTPKVKYILDAPSLPNMQSNCT